VCDAVSGYPTTSATEVGGELVRAASKFCEPETLAAAWSYWSYRTSPGVAAGGAQNASAQTAAARGLSVSFLQFRATKIKRAPA
jgi:hypothetical protein